MVADQATGREAFLVVRQYEQADAAACCRVINDAVVNMDGLNGAARDRVRASNSPARLDKDLGAWHTLVCEHGTLGLVAVGALDGNEIKRVYVHPEAHGLGAGRAVMAALEATAQQAGRTLLRLEASTSSVSFYAGLGYLAEDEATLAIDDAVFRFVRMPKQL